MILKSIIDTDTVNYKKICMTLIFPKCNFKCNADCGKQVCHNIELTTLPDINIEAQTIIDNYMNYPVTESLCLQGLEPLDSWEDVLSLIDNFRKQSQDDIVIYTGYTEEEAQWYIKQLQPYDNIIMKFGRFIPDQRPHYDQVLGVYLASDNQYAKKIS